MPVLTVICNSRGACRKTISLDENCKPVKTSKATIASGIAKRVSVSDIVEFAELRESLSSSEVLAYGTFQGKAIQPLRLKSDPAIDFGAAIARSKQFFTYPEVALLFIDCDGTELNAEQIDLIIGSIYPPWRNVERMIDASSGSFLADKDGQFLSKLSGWHLYAAVTPGSLIPEFVAWLHRSLWRLGFGHIEVSKSGALLERGLIDVSCCQPERLDFTAPAKLLDGI